MKKKVALINPGKRARFDAHEPLNIGFIAAVLEEKHGVEVKIIDELAGQDIELELDRFKPDFAGITATTPFADDAYRTAKICRKSGIITVMGGVHASILSDEALNYVDIVVKGEGEEAMRDIVLDNIRERIISRPYIRDLDSIPRPAYHLMNMDFYLSARDRAPYNTALIFIPKGYKVASMLTSRGCPYSCIFCHNSWKGIPFRGNSPERVIEDIKYLVNTYKVKALIFFDDDFFAIKKRTRKICELIKENDIDIIWGCNGRVDTVDADTLKIAKQAGCRQVAFGMESGSQKILDVLNKRTTVQQNRDAIRMCKEAGVSCVAFFILGNPHENYEDIELTRKFILQNVIDCIGLCIATPFPGTKLWDWCGDNKFIPPGVKWSDFSPDDSSLRVSEFVTPEEIKRLRSRIFLEFAFKKNSFSQFLKMSLRQPFQAVKKAYRVFKHLG
jgi:anaerobic magnesium-protoporphyrin IX monomethyl ester cyclase